MILTICSVKICEKFSKPDKSKKSIKSALTFHFSSGIMQYIKAKALWKISMAPFAVVQKGASGDADVLNGR